MLHQFYDDTSWNFGGYLKRIILLGIGMIESTPALYVGGVRYLTRDHTGEDKEKNKYRRRKGEKNILFIEEKKKMKR